MPNVAISADLCKKCGSCAAVCPEAILVQEQKGAIPVVQDTDECVACGQCATICPAGAIMHGDYPADKLLLLQPELFPNADQAFELLASRRSIRSFSSAPVEREKIEKILTGVHLAPTARNARNVQVVVVTKPDTLRSIVELTLKWQAAMPNAPKSFKRLASDYARGKERLLHSAPVAIFFHADSRDEFVEVGCSLALQNCTLLAHSLGLGVFYAGYVTFAAQQDSAIPKLLGIPDNHRIYGALALGQPRTRFRKRMDRTPPVTTWLE